VQRQKAKGQSEKGCRTYPIDWLKVLYGINDHIDLQNEIQYILKESIELKNILGSRKTAYEI